ncbi:filamentous hemagglutinin family protein [Janthinobacterium sp. 35]|uniref:YDG domain-containing protein n=1 Tax=Janthinobacterium sp. 35 TaxID=2035210 RepID=UPI000C19AF03|nr:YDG domain-containing protein [Janthinobacterium sp. 35]PIG29505.1 filamentous hemagglutinin family protein [Janthinobacterium sp. 35]
MTKQKPLRSVPAGGPVEPPLRRTALALLIAACFSAAHANPVLPQVVHGQATFNQQGNLFTITNTPNTIINWQSFSVNPGEITRFLQQSAGSSVLNRITGQDPSKILGSLQSNGKVFLINPNGVLFGRDARVDVAGLVASSLALSNQDFLAGKMHFNAGEQAGAVINQGTIHAGSGGQILLIAPNVENSGIITAPNGDVLLAAGHSVQLADAANPDLRVVLSAPADQAINVGQIVAQGGRIGMAGALLNQRGVLNANSAVVGENGKIVLKASGKTLLENGSVTSATSAAGKGGEITVLGDQIGMQGNARVDASGATGGGTVLLGGDYQGKNPAIANARQVAVGKDATIAADANQSGDGGKVIVWGNETARVFGSISARGGAASGNGGLVETSGHYLAVDGIRVDTSARRGKRGNWLLDPYDIEVVGGYHGQLEDFDQFSEEPSDTTIGADTISSASSTVTLQATHSITFSSAISMGYEDAGLIAIAGESIYVNAPITTQRGEVTLSANDAISNQANGPNANVYLNAAISTNSGTVALSGASIISDIAGGGTVNVGSGKLSLKSNLAGGAIDLQGSGDQLAGSGASGQTVLLQADNIHFSGNLNFRGTSNQAALTFKPLSDGRQIELGSQSDTALALTNDELNRVAAGTINIGDASSGNITISGPVNLDPSSSIATLNLKTGGTLTASSKLAMRQAGSALNVKASNVIVASGGGLSADATVSLVADNMSLGGAAQSIAAGTGTGTGTGTVSLKRRSNSGSIEIGSAGEDSADSLGLSDSELKTISAPSIAIGGSDYAGTLNLQGALDLRTSSNLNLLELRTAGNINLNGALAVGKDLTIGAGTSGPDWLVNAYGIVNVGGAFVLDGGNWVQNNASLPAFTAHSFTINNGTFLRVKGGNGEAATPYRIADVYGLQGIGTQGYNKNYALVANIDASGTANWNLSESRTGFAPLFSGDEFAYAGIFDGGNHSISGLTINGGATPLFFGSGLFARTQGGIIRNLSMLGGSVTGGNNVGAVVGNNGGATISNVSSSMAVSGNNNVGGLVGDNNSGGTITVARASGTVTASGERVGGLVGNNDGTISQAYATGAVGGGASVGGLVGRNGGAIEDVYATGAIGLSADSAASQQNLGGVIGWSVAGSSARRLYFSGAVSGSGFAPDTVGAVVGRADSGAVVGPAFFDSQSAGTVNDPGGSAGRSTAEMKQQSSFGGFNFGQNAIWRIYEGHTTPLLKAFLTPLTVSASGAASRVYDGQVASVGQLSYIGLLNGDLAASGTASYGNARNVGNYALGGLWSTQYDISYAGTSTVAITPRALSVILSGSKVYDGQLGFANATLSLGNTVSGDTVGVTGSAQFVDKNAGSDKAVNLSELTLSGSAMGNYSLAATAIGTAEITQRTLNLAFAGANKVYDGNTAASLTITDNRIANDVLTATAIGAFADKNAGSSKAVTVRNASLSGADAANYVLASTTGATSAAITQRELALVFAAAGKTYDGNTAASLTITDNRVANDVLTATAIGAFADKNAGSNKAVTVRNASLSGADADNYVLASTTGATSAAITQRELALVFAAAGKTYDGNTAASLTITDNRIANDVLTATAIGAFADKNAGANKAVTVRNARLSGTDADNYVLASTTGTASAAITQRELALGFAAAGKTYDGNTAATLAITDNRIANDVLTATAIGAFADKNAGANKGVTVRNARLSGADADNYVLTSTTGATSAAISQRELALGFAAAGKTYDGNTAATLAITDNRVANDVLTATAIGAFADKNAGSNKVVTVRNARLSGADADNYVLASTTGATSAAITQRELALVFAAAGKTYDGNTSATLAITDNRVANDVLTATAIGAFADKNAGAAKAVTVRNASLSGADADNYVLASTTGATSAAITQRELALGFAAAGKTYDGNTAASLTITDNRVANDVLTATASGAFADKNAGSNKAVTVRNASLSGADADNYVLASTTGATSAAITQRELALGFAAAGKTYDGNTSATLAITDNRVANDVLTATASGAFADKNAGANKAVTVRNASLSGADADNYVLASTTGATSAAITQRELALVFAAAGKTYDGNTAASLTITDNRVANDVLTATAIGAFADKNAGATKAVTVRNASLSGADADNYVLASTTGATSAAISQRELALVFAAAGKTYDGNTAATLAITDNRVANDVLTATAIGAFADKNAGSNKVVTVRNASLSGADADNYVLASTTGATSAAISQRELALVFAAAGKTYDGNTAATLAITDNRVANDVLTATAIGAFADKNAGAAKAVTVRNARLSGADADNYVLASTTGATSAAITQRELALVFAAAGKTYDGNTSATLAITDNRVANDVLTATAIGAFADKNAGSNKAVTVRNARLSGADADNYVLASTTGATSAAITQRELALGFAAAGKTYDGNTAATLAITDNRIANDVLTATAIGAFADKNAGATKAVTVRNASLSGADATNYVLTSTTGAASATITQRELALVFAAAGKTYDGNSAASLTITDNRIANDVLTATASGEFADKNAGANKGVTVRNASLSGTDAANYVLTSTTGATSATITQRELALVFAAAGKTYDGNTSATLAITDNRVANDVLTATAIGAFADKNAGANKGVTVRNASLSGADADNYVLASTTGATSAAITQRELALVFAAAGKIYDGNTSATLAITDNRVANDVLTATAIGAFADKNAGANKAVTVQNASLSGLDAGNYTLGTSGGMAMASIAQRALNLGYTGVDKVYDGVTGAQVAISDDRIAGDVLSASASAAFADKNAGSGKTITVQNASLSGNDAGNYRLANTTGATTATIARAALTLASVSASDKVYDGTQVANVSGTVAGVIGQDAVSLVGGSGTFADRNYGSGKTVNVSGFGLSGADAGNYALTASGGVVQASIAQRALSTWIGAAGGLWSDAANWEGGVAPSGANVLAADFAASTGNVVYTAAAGDTVLDRLSSRGGLNLTGGSLLVNNALTVANYAQTGGLLGGLGNMTVSNSFNQSAGAIHIGGNLAVTQAAGDLRFAALTANAISLNAGAGAISQSGAVVAGSLATQSQTGTVLNDAGNRVKNFSASNSGAGGIALTSTSAPDVLVLGSLATGTGDVRIESTGGIDSHAITTAGGNVSLIAHSPVNVLGVVQGNDVTVDASTDVAFGDGARVNAARTIAVTAGAGVTFAGAATLDVQATGAINVLAKNGDLTAAETVRINSRGAPVSLLAPNGRVIVPASVLVAQPVTTPVVPPGTIISAVNTLPALSEQYNPLNQLTKTNNVTTPLLAGTTSKESTKEAPDELQKSIKKTYCN